MVDGSEARNSFNASFTIVLTCKGFRSGWFAGRRCRCTSCGYSRSTGSWWSRRPGLGSSFEDIRFVFQAKFSRPSHEPLPVHALRASRVHLQVGSHHLFNPADFRIIEQPADIELHVSFIELQSLQCHVHTDFVAKLETVDERLFRVVDSERYSVDSLFLNSSASLSRPILLSQSRLFYRADFISCRRPNT